jgi:hypothetical protein
MIQIVAESIQKQEDQSLLKYVVDLAENTPKFFRLHIEPLLLMCTQEVANKQLLESWRQMALEVMVTLAKTEPVAAAALTDAAIKKRIVVVESRLNVIYFVLLK